MFPLGVSTLIVDFLLPSRLECLGNLWTLVGFEPLPKLSLVCHFRCVFTWIVVLPHEVHGDVESGFPMSIHYPQRHYIRSKRLPFGGICVLTYLSSISDQFLNLYSPLFTIPLVGVRPGWDRPRSVDYLVEMTPSVPVPTSLKEKYRSIVNKMYQLRPLYDRQTSSTIKIRCVTGLSIHNTLVNRPIYFVLQVSLMHWPDLVIHPSVCPSVHLSISLTLYEIFVRQTGCKERNLS